jgi:hypothetical protein
MQIHPPTGRYSPYLPYVNENVFLCQVRIK